MSRGRRPTGLLGLSLNDRTILFLVIFLDKTVFASRRSPKVIIRLKETPVS